VRGNFPQGPPCSPTLGAGPGGGEGASVSDTITYAHIVWPRPMLTRDLFTVSRLIFFLPSHVSRSQSSQRDIVLPFLSVYPSICGIVLHIYIFSIFLKHIYVFEPHSHYRIPRGTASANSNRSLHGDYARSEENVYGDDHVLHTHAYIMTKSFKSSRYLRGRTV